ncbi:MAG: polyprenol monophosphomannose synthase [Candidatus Bathyarchaeota archaeon]|nr:polyprenol monophosphomannose synthase [Candidatus Bathyarchaeota archaeon]
MWSGVGLGRDSPDKASVSPELSVIVPTYMERENIAELIERIELSLSDVDFEIVIVDDSSPDGTAEYAESLGHLYGNVKVVKRPGKLGLSSAVLDGFMEASGKVLAVIDADLQHPPELLRKMYEMITRGHDLVIGSRYVTGGDIRGWGLRRRIISRVAVFLAHIMVPRSRKIKDAVSGFFMLKRCVVEGVPLKPVGFKILLEIVAKGRYENFVEVPYTFQSRRKGRSSFNRKEAWNYIVHLSRLLRSK